LNRIILKEPFWKDALTEEGKPSRKEIIPGIYKTSPNSVLTRTNEVFHYASPLETPAKMEELMAWLKEQFAGGMPDPIAVAARFHHRFLLIHPFDDGNGRVARLLSNYILLKCGCPPVIVKSADKENYLAVLRLADAGQTEPLTDYFEDQLEWSLDIALRAARGESVEEPTDVEKELELFIRSQKADPTPPEKVSREALLQLSKNGLKDLVLKLESKITKLAPLFAESTIRVEGPEGPIGADLGTIFPGHLGTRDGPSHYLLAFSFHGYKGHTLQPFSFALTVSLDFQDYQYIVQSEGVPELRKPYSQRISSGESDAFSAAALKQAFSSIKERSGQDHLV
jgi:hypothetical protein